MVAVSGRGWSLAPCLVSMVREANQIAPGRNRQADGSIGDAAHRNRTSDHNPSSGWVCAVDLTHSPSTGFDAHARAREVVANQDPRIKYVISNGQIARAYAKPGIPAWTWVPYFGSNPHKLHAHFSINNTSASRDDTSPWWPTNPPEEEIVFTVAEAGEYVDEAYVLITGKSPSNFDKYIWAHAIAEDPREMWKMQQRLVGQALKQALGTR